MITVDGLNYDILELIFAHLARDELVSVSLVNQAFLQGALPHLYHTLVYRIAHKKKYPRMMSPFQTILLHPRLAVHVRCCEISAIPVERSLPRCDFITQCISALEKCSNLSGFYCTPNVLPSFISLLPAKSRLKALHAKASLTQCQTDILAQVSGLRRLRLDNASWCVVHMLPQWIESMKGTLTSLSIHLSNELNKYILSTVLSNLPNLTALHIRSCPRIDHITLLRLVANNSQLEELGFTTWEVMNGHGHSLNDRYLVNANLSSLKTLTIETRNLAPDSDPAVWKDILSITRKSGSPLKNLSLSLSETAKMSVSLVNEILGAHGKTLTSLKLINCELPVVCLETLTKGCKNLEKLHVAIPGKETDALEFARALAPSKSLRVLVDDTEHMRLTNTQVWLNHKTVRALMEHVPSLQKLISDRRCWMGEVKDNGKYHLSFTTLPSGTLQVTY